jgi:hypothetical protein
MLNSVLFLIEVMILNSKKNYLIVLFLSGFMSCFAQNWWATDSVELKQPKKGSVTVFKDSGIDKLVEFKGTAIPPAFEPQIKGYRVHLFFSQEKSIVTEARTRFISQFREIPNYLEYNAPSYNLYVGDFRTKLEAEKLKSECISEFPDCIVIETMIYLPKLD